MTFKDLFDKLDKTNKKVITVAGAEKSEIIKACFDAKTKNIADFIFVGNKDKIEKTIDDLKIDKNLFEIIDVKSTDDVAHVTCNLFKEGKTHLIMKGSVSTGALLKKVLDKQYGLRGSGFLSHIALIQWNNKLIGITDGGLNIAPTLEEKIKITSNAIDFYHKIGINIPKVALVSAVEIPSTEMQSTIDASIIAKMGERGSFNDAIVDGPFGFDNAISKHAAEIKGIDSPVAGDADIIVAPDIEAANMCAKGIIYSAKMPSGGVVIGSTTPIILLSRADDAETKFNSIVLALAYLN